MALKGEGAGTVITELKERVALACRVLYAKGLASSLGHVSARVPGEDLVVIKARRSPQVPSLGWVTADETGVVDLDGRRLEGKHEPPGETPLHTEIYRARDDVGGVVHLHPKWSTALGAAGREISPILHVESKVVAAGMPVYESPELVRSREQGARLAATLGGARAAHLRNHGIVTVGGDVESASLNAIWLERLAEANYLAARLGTAKPLDEGAVRTMEASAREEGGLHWDYYRTLDPLHRRSGEAAGRPAPPADLPSKVAAACRILYRRGLVEYVEHVSARLPGERFLINPIRSMEDIGADALITVDFDGSLVAGGGRVPGHVFLHAEIYRARPDVAAIVHTHPPFGRAFGMTGVPVLPLLHDRSYPVVRPPAVYDRPELFKTSEQGRQAVHALGDAEVLHLRGHGMEFLADSVERATVMAVHFEELAEANHIARQLGTPSTVSAEVAASQRPKLESIQSEWGCLLGELE